MKNDITPDERAKHLRTQDPSPWVTRFAPLVAKNINVLDIAAGSGRHSLLFLQQGSLVTAIDKDTTALSSLTHQKKLEIIEFDLETVVSVYAKGNPLFARTFGAIVVVNYLYRPLFSHLIDSLIPGGLLIYETFALGNETYARPRNPEHLLKSGELLKLVKGQMQIVAYEHGVVANGDIPGVKQRLCAVKDLSLSERKDHEPPAHAI